MRSIAILFLIILTLLLAGLLLITKRLAANLWKPFYETLQLIENFELDKNNTPVFKKTSTVEFDRWNRSINKLIEKNTIIYQSQREFIEHAAHELQTPLAVFQSKLDLLIQQQGITEEKFYIANSLNENVSRLARLNKNLLLISKIENASYHHRQTISVNEMINKHMSFYIEQADAKQINIQLNFINNINLNANSTLVEVLLGNMFMNAISHNTTGGHILVSTGSNSITFTNTGKKQPLEGDKIFQRFYKGNSYQHGTGLGLSIMKKITELYNWKLLYQYESSQYVFTVIF